MGTGACFSGMAAGRRERSPAKRAVVRAQRGTYRARALGIIVHYGNHQMGIRARIRKCAKDS